MKCSSLPCPGFIQTFPSLPGHVISPSPQVCLMVQIHSASQNESSVQGPLAGSHASNIWSI